ncbi:MAG TPA: PhzF family phenazine biosynthesis isomerase [Candidatus Krumholzibacteria bacterium]|nr:PhzF family phenazine biosynthesis isomerase [Candidatus Krumholzibacteria bacterium]HPD72301.1 PhzF family phenazine biosynthesis isomerase [Candidatus Krumholzibacteria bacterium]HRY40767.1 PhzF family phenazine biosynthesis isomerase [Candidatus Krumholzibacteria bacterium]
MAVIPLHIVDAFTDRPFAGNPAAIIPNAANLGDEEMAKISEELGMEVGFVLPPDVSGADVRLRFFVDRREDSLSGHVLLAAFTSMVDRGIFRPTPAGVLLHVETLAGVLEVRLIAEADGLTRVVFEMPNPRFGEYVPVDEVARALGAPAEFLRIAGHGPQRVSCGFDQILVPVADRTIMRASLPGMAGIRVLLDERGAAGVALFCPETVREYADFQCRFIHPGDRRCEDIASGICLAAIGAYAVHHGLLPPAEVVRVVTEQGHLLGRPTIAEIEVRCLGDRIHRIQLSGTGAVVMRGSLQFNRFAGATARV